MTATFSLYDAMNDFLSQRDRQWHDVRHSKTLCWMMVGMIESQNVHLNGFGVYINSRLSTPNPINDDFGDASPTAASIFLRRTRL